MLLCAHKRTRGSLLTAKRSACLSLPRPIRAPSNQTRLHQLHSSQALRCRGLANPCSLCIIRPVCHQQLLKQSQRHLSVEGHWLRVNCLKHSHVTIKNPARGRGGEYLVGAVIAISSVATKGSFLARLKWGDSRHAVFVGNARKNS